MKRPSLRTNVGRKKVPNLKKKKKERKEDWERGGGANQGGCTSGRPGTQGE